MSTSPCRARRSAPASRRSSATRRKDWVEAVYVYPLPPGGAVDTLKMVIGDRVVVGDIKERQQARVDLRAGQAQRTEGRADRAGAAEHLHQLGRQYRPRRNRAGADRISGAGAAVRQRILAAGADGGRRRATIRRRSCRASTSAPTAAAGARPQSDPVPDRDRISPPVLDPANNAPVNPTSITVRLQAGFPLGEVKSHHHAIKIEKRRRRHARHHARRRPGAGRPRLRADLEAGGREGAVGRAVSRACRRCRLSARLRHAARRSSRPQQKPLPREVDLRDRQFRLDGRHLDRAGQGEPASTRSAACSRTTAST